MTVHTFYLVILVHRSTFHNIFNYVNIEYSHILGWHLLILKIHQDANERMDGLTKRVDRLEKDAGFDK